MDVMLAMKKAFNERTPEVLMVKWISWTIFILSIACWKTLSTVLGEAAVSVSSHIPSSLVCLVDCRLSATHLVAHCLDGHNSSEKAAAWRGGCLPDGADRVVTEVKSWFAPWLVWIWSTYGHTLTAEPLEG